MKCPPLGIIGSVDLTGVAPFSAGEQLLAHTRYGSVELYHGEGWALVHRHGRDCQLPPHRINHRANVAALHELGVRGVVAFCSVGGLRADLAPGTWVVPDDFLSLAPPVTFFDDQARHVTPKLDAALRAVLVEAMSSLGLPHHDGGVYCQTAGPRLETRAEVRMIAQFADLVGMTFAHEATLCIEVELPVAAACHVHNLAHGIAGSVPSDVAIVDSKRRDAETIGAIAQVLIARAGRQAQQADVQRPG